MSDASRSVDDGERRYATVLFADISGFTSMSERLDPEEVRVLINRCFETLEAVVQEHSGHVDKYIGDCIMALFGVPKALESAPRQAINAAIDMRNRVREFNRTQRVPAELGVHIGINSGLVLTGHVGGAVKREYTVVGDAVNLASRLKEASPNWAIYVGPETHRHTADEFEFRELRRQKMKGKGVPIDVYEVLSDKEHVHRRKPARDDRRISSEIVGRDAELRQLRECLSRVAGGHGGIVNIVGDAGIGKSRLIAEVAAVGEAAAVRLLEGRSLSVGRSLRFHPFVDLLRQWAGIAEDDGEQQGIAKLETSVTRLFGDDGGEILPFVATLMGLRVGGAHAGRIAGIEGEAMETLILKSTRELLERIAAERPLVLVFEDLHWADQSSIKLLESLLRLVASAPVLFVHVLRPEHRHSSGRILTAAREHHRRHTVEIALRPLDARECDQLIQNLLSIDDLPPGTRAAIARKAEGNPFFIEEVIRSLVDEGVIEYHHGRFRVTTHIDSVEIPGTIQEVIMARVDRLPEQPRRLLQIASVIGRSFPYRILGALWDAEEQLELALGYLRRSQLLEEGRAGGEREYMFKHALAQETVYGSILHAGRKELHLRVAERIEELFADRLADFYGMLAYHFNRAEKLEKAEEYLFQAGAEAARSAAASEALSYFQEASRLFILIHGEGGDPAKKALLEKNIGLALLNTGQLTESIDHFDAALEYLGERVPRTAVMRGVWFAVDFVSVLGFLYTPRPFRRFGRERAHDREALQIRYNRARAQLTTDPKRYFLDTIGSFRRLEQTDARRIDQACGMYAGGAALFAYSGLPFRIGRRFLDVAKDLMPEGSRRERFLYRSMQFVHEYFKGDWDEQWAIDEAFVDEMLRYGQIFEIFVYVSLNAERLGHRGEWNAARRQIDRLKSLSDVYGFDFAKSSEYAMRAILLLEKRQFAPTMEALDFYYANQREEVFNLFALGTRAKSQVLSGDRAGARATLAAAEDLERRLGRVRSLYHFSVYAVSRFLYDVTALEEQLAGSDGQPERTLWGRARKSGRRATSAAAKIASVRPEVYRLAGRLWWAVGKPDRAIESWERSVRAAKALGARPELARSYMDAGSRLATVRQDDVTLDGMAGSACVDAARRLLDALDLDSELQRLEAEPGSGAGRVAVNGR